MDGITVDHSQCKLRISRSFARMSSRIGTLVSLYSCGCCLSVSFAEDLSTHELCSQMLRDRAKRPMNIGRPPQPLRHPRDGPPSLQSSTHRCSRRGLKHLGLSQVQNSKGYLCAASIRGFQGRTAQRNPRFARSAKVRIGTRPGKKQFPNQESVLADGNFITFPFGGKSSFASSLRSAYRAMIERNSSSDKYVSAANFA